MTETLRCYEMRQLNGTYGLFEKTKYRVKKIHDHIHRTLEIRQKGAEVIMNAGATWLISRDGQSTNLGNNRVHWKLIQWFGALED